MGDAELRLDDLVSRGKSGREATKLMNVKLPTWADVFRRIGLDERDHMNTSFVFCGEPERVVDYDGMREKSDLIHSRR